MAGILQCDGNELEITLSWHGAPLCDDFGNTRFDYRAVMKPVLTGWESGRVTRPDWCVSQILM